MTRKQAARARAAEWRAALLDGRVVRWSPVDLTSYPTIAARDAAIEKMRADGLEPQIVRVTP